MLRGVLAIALLTGCSSPTRILVVVDSDFAVPSQLSTLSVGAWRVGAGPSMGELVGLTGHTVDDPSGDARTQLPLSFAVIDRGFPETGVEVLVRGLDGSGNMLVERRAIVDRFVAGRTLVLPMFLGRACALDAVPPVVCGSDRTCDDGVCVAVNVRADTLRFVTAPGEELVLDAGQATDGGMRDGEVEPDGAVDGGVVADPIAWVTSGPMSNHTCALTEGGTLLCWGQGTEGQLGDGTTGGSNPNPTPVLWPAGVGTPAAVATGSFHTCASAIGGVYCWGENAEFGLLGDGTAGAQTAPVPVLGLSPPYGSVALGAFHTCAVAGSLGRALCWGDDHFGQVGDGGGFSMEPLTPRGVVDLVDVLDLSAGASHTCARMVANNVMCWGNNGEGELGDPARGDADIAVPAGVDDARAIASGAYHVCAIRAFEERVWCWGNNDSGQLGRGDTLPQDMPGPTNATGAVMLAAGATHTCALLNTRTVACWGQNDRGQLGPTVPIGQVSGPIIVTGLSDITHITAGAQHTCARRDDGRVLCWGANTNGELGSGSTTPASRAQPETIAWP